MAGEKWNRDETLIAFNIYCRLPFGRLHSRNPEIIEAAVAMGRTPSALAMKCCNLAAFDPALAARGIKGLSKGSKLDEEVWRGFENRPEETAFESELAYSRLTDSELRVEDEVCWEDVRGLDKVAITKVRVNQHFFRSLVVAGYRCQCAVCEIPFAELLVASHIVPWSIDKSERMNPQNGICLCSIHDRAFDKGLLRIGGDYQISLSGAVWKKRDAKPVQDYLLRFDGRSINLPDRWYPAAHFLERHAQFVASSICKDDDVD